MPLLYKKKSQRILLSTITVSTLIIAIFASAFFLWQYTISDNTLVDEEISPFIDIHFPDYDNIEDKLEIFNPYEANKYSDASILDYAEKLASGFLVVSDSFVEEVPYDIDNIDWNMQATSSPNTFSLFMHALNPVFFLCKAYNITKNERYYDLAEKMLDSWIAYLLSSTPKNTYTWYDHSVALRTDNMIYFYVMQEKYKDNPDEYLIDIIRTHADWLMDDRNYVAQHNHGIFEDAALLKAGYFLQEAKKVDYAIQRLDKQLHYAFPNQSAHIENSSGYNIGVLDFVVSVSNYLEKVENPYAHQANEYLMGTLDFLTYTIPPNGIIPAYGDTFKSPSSNKSLSTGSLKALLGRLPNADKNMVDNLLYATAQGTEGVSPQNKTRVFLQDGYAFLRSSWDKEHYLDAFYLLFKSGFLSLTHKHKDDVSFILNNKGIEIFIDPGMYNYMVGNVYADYLNETFAHNTIIVDNASYPIGGSLTEKVGLLPSITTPEYSIFRGYNNLYHGVWIDRSVIYVNENMFFIVDEIQADKQHNYTQNFHLSNNVKLLNHDIDKTIIKLTNSEWNLVINQLIPVDQVSLKKGDTGDISTMSIMSNGLNLFEETTSIQFNKRGQNERFITSFQFVSDNDLEDALAINAYTDKNNLVIDNTTIDITPRIRAVPTSIHVAIDGIAITVANPDNQDKGLLSCYYVYEEGIGIVSKSDYQYDSRVEFVLDQGKHYAIIGYSRTLDGQRSSWHSGYLVPTGNSYEFIPIPNESSVPFIIEREMLKEGYSYVFSLKKDGFSTASTRWYVYLNGSSYDYMEGDKLQYFFSEPGSYTILYRIRDILFGEIEFGHFPEIIISR